MGKEIAEDEIHIQSGAKAIKSQDTSEADRAQSRKDGGPADLELQATTSAPLHTVFTKTQIRFIVAMTAVGAFFSPLSGQIYFPAIPDLADHYDTSIGGINLTITTYMIFQGLAPTFMGSFGDSTGRRPAYLLTFTIYLAANIGLACQDSYTALLVLRMLQSAGSSGTIALAYGVIADISTPAERGKYMGPTAATALLAPAFAPLIGGALNQSMGWRSIFWFLGILSLVYLVIYALFMPETARKVVGNGSIPPNRWYNTTMWQMYQKWRQRKRGVEVEEQELVKAKFHPPNPLKSLRVLKEKDVALVLLFAAFGMVASQAMLASMSPLFAEVYDFDSLQVGLCYIPIGVAAILAALLNGRLMDWNYRRWAGRLNFPLEKKKAQDLRNFPIEKVRLQLLFFLTPIGIAFYVPQGWVLAARVHLAVPLVIEFISAYCMLSSSNAVTSLLVDLYPDEPSTVSAANNLVRTFFSAGVVAALDPMLKRLGWGWTFTFLGLLLGLSMVLLSVIWVKGMGWREERRLKVEESKRMKDEKQKVKESE